MFLCILKRTVIDVVAEAAIPEIPEVLEVIEDLGANPPVLGVAPEAAIPAVPAVDEVSHLEVENIWIEKFGSEVARLVARSAEADFYEIQLDANLAPTLSAISEKPGGRQPAPPREMVQLVNAGGADVGRHIIK